MASDGSDFRSLGRRLSNWGRWGPDDERGTMNLITPERLVAATRLVRHGRIFDLSIPLDRRGPQLGTYRTNPVHLMTMTGTAPPLRGGLQATDDYIFMPLQAGTQWDSLAHVFYDNTLYNGYPSTTVSSEGASRNSIDKQAKGVAGRGVLCDVARHHGVEVLSAGHAIDADQLEATVAAQEVAAGPGDILLVRTGWRRVLSQGSAAEFQGPAPGLDLSCCEWLRSRDIAAVCADTPALEVRPLTEPEVVLPVHMVLIRDMGMMLGEIFDLEELAADCARDGVWEFLFVASPLKVTAAVGSPINPLAIK